MPIEKGKKPDDSGVNAQDRSKRARSQSSGRDYHQRFAAMSAESKRIENQNRFLGLATPELHREKRVGLVKQSLDLAIRYIDELKKIAGSNGNPMIMNVEFDRIRNFDFRSQNPAELEKTIEALDTINVKLQRLKEEYTASQAPSSQFESAMRNIQETLSRFGDSELRDRYEGGSFSPHYDTNWNRVSWQEERETYQQSGQLDLLPVLVHTDADVQIVQGMSLSDHQAQREEQQATISSSTEGNTFQSRLDQYPPMTRYIVQKATELKTLWFPEVPIGILCVQVANSLSPQDRQQLMLEKSYLTGTGRIWAVR